jgi:hypothetical protein
MTDPTTPTPPEQPAMPFQVPQTPPTDGPQMPGSPDPIGHGAAAPGESPQAPKRRKKLLIAAGATTALLLTGIGVLASLETDTPAPNSAVTQEKSLFAEAKKKCGSSLASDAELGDEGRTLTLHGDGKESSGLSYVALECYWSELGLPDSAKAEFGATRALDGRLTGEWGDIHASWSYHPNSGLQMVLTLAN